MQPHPFLSFLAFPLPFFSFRLSLFYFLPSGIINSSFPPPFSARQGSQLHRIQKTTENIHVSDGLRRIVTFLIIAPYLNTYLLSPLSVPFPFPSPLSTLLFPRGREATPLTQLGSLGERCKLPTVGSKKIHYLFILGIFCACETYLVVATVFVLSVRNSVVFEANLAFTFPGTGRCPLGRSQVGQVPCCPSLRAPMLLHALCETLRFRFHGDV